MSEKKLLPRDLGALRKTIVEKVRSQVNYSGDRGAFESATIHRIATESVRVWIIEHWLRTQTLPQPEVMFVYPRGPQSLEWGAADGSPDEFAPLRGKRIRVTLEIENER